MSVPALIFLPFIRQCWFNPLIFNRSFDNIGSSPSFFKRSFNNVGFSPSFLTCHLTMLVPWYPVYMFFHRLCVITIKERGWSHCRLFCPSAPPPALPTALPPAHPLLTTVGSKVIFTVFISQYTGQSSANF
jgi:hypothetical protein